MNSLIKDQLSWEEFYMKSVVNKKINKIEPFNRLIAHSKNFFLIAGYGAFTPGYLILITKDFLPAYGLIDKNLDELNFIIQLTKENISKNLNRRSLIFEHGMCACIGGLDRAHLHIMSIGNKSSEKSLIQSINKTLHDRKSGIKYIQYKNYKLENIHDINHFLDTKNINSKNDSDFKIFGKILKLNDIKNLNEKKWPGITLPHIMKGGHYVFLRSDYSNASFLTTNNFQTQFGRQVTFENEMFLDILFKKNIENIVKSNEFLETWKWQNCKFEKNVIETVNLTKLQLESFKNKYQAEFKEFEFKVI